MKKYIRRKEISNELSDSFVEFEGLWMSRVNELLSFAYLLCLSLIKICTYTYISTTEEQCQTTPK